MTNITEADHDAVDWLYEMGVIAPHHLRLANEAFARHREQTERQTADLIETQAREIERLREALEVIRDGDYPYKQASQYARAALAGDSHD